MRYRLRILSMLAALGLSILNTANAATRVWDGPTGDWTNAANWGGAVPQDGDNAVFVSGSLTVATNTAYLGSFSMTNGTLTFTNWTTTLIATNINITAGTINHVKNSATATNVLGEWPKDGRVYFACSNFYLNAGATINADYKGWQATRQQVSYTTGYGYGGGTAYSSAGYGGNGARSSYGDAGDAYGSPEAPEDPGSGGGGSAQATPPVGDGGGAVRLAASGLVTINGTITANGRATVKRTGGGSGGGIYITCDRFAGTNGSIQAIGGVGGTYGGGGGGGGRIAVVYNTTSQASMPVPGVLFSVRGNRWGNSSGAKEYGDVGTLYFSDNQFLEEVFVHSGEWRTGISFTNWAPDNLIVSNGWLRFPTNGFVLTVTNDIKVLGSDYLAYKLEFTSAQISCGRDFVVSGSDLRFRTDQVIPPRAYCGRDFVVTNTARMSIWSAITNGSVDYGALVAVTGDFVVADASIIYPRAHNTNGAAPLFQVSNLTVRTGGTIEAYALGFRGSLGGAERAGLGPGAGSNYGAGGHGGQGGYVGQGGDAYGSASAPMLPGSGGGNGSTAPGAPGGGLVRVEASGAVTIDGTISANGRNGVGYVAGGSGGGIYIECNTIEGGGIVQANGGNVSDGRYGRGGGGRIAVIYDTSAQAAVPVPDVVFSVLGYERNMSHLYGDLGTLYFPDARLLTDTIRHTGDIIIPGLTSWGTNSLTITNGWIRFSQEGFVLTVTNDLLITGSSAALELVPAHTNWTPGQYFSAGSSGSTLRVGGNVSIANGAWLYLASSATNDSTPAYGGLVEIGGTLSIGGSSVAYLCSSHTNGGSMYLELGGLNVASGGVVAAGSRGFGVLVNNGPTAHIPGVGDWRGGAGHGGVGGTYGAYNGGPTYGSSNKPVTAGSAADNTYSRSGIGGGVVTMDIEGTATIDGTVSANGGNSTYIYDAGGSGGSIWLWCRTFDGMGTLSAIGGSGGTSYNKRNTGGGGRIALWRAYDTFTGIVTVDPGTPEDGYTANAGTGTVVYVDTGPSITNLPATNVTATTADLVGSLTATGQAPSEVYCYWGPIDQAQDKASWATNLYLGTNSISVITNSVTGLPAGANTYYRFYATNMYGDNWGDPFAVFSTIGQGTVNNADGPTNVTQTGATLRGDVTSGNPTPKAYICWGDADGGANTGAWQYASYMGETLGAISISVSNLLANKTYYYRCFVTNSSGPAWAATKTNFTTLSPTMWIDNPPALLEGDAGTKDMNFTVTISEISAIDVTVVFNSSDGWAESGSDYVATNGVLTISAGQVTGIVTVVVKGDFIDEYPYQEFYLILSAPTGVTLVDNIATGVITDDDDATDTKNWNGTGDWTSFTNWNPTGTPGPLDNAIVESGTVTISGSANILSLFVTNGATLAFTNWMTRLTVSNLCNIAGTVTTRGTFTDSDMSNRVWIVCSNLFVDGSINVNYKGYRGITSSGSAISGNGPGKGSGYGAGGHGGRGGYGGGGAVYGVASAPKSPGSSGGSNNSGSTSGHGGGAVRIDASGYATINGSITADGRAAFGGYSAGGSGGSIYITCRTLHGTNGTVSANGGTIVDARWGRGGGGRIAVVYNTTAQASEEIPGIVFSAMGPDSLIDIRYGDLGTVYFPDNKFLTSPLLISGEIVIPGLTEWRINSLTIDNTSVRFDQEGFVLTVTNDLVITGTKGHLELGGNEYTHYQSRDLYSDMTSGPSLYVRGDLVLTNGGSIYIMAGETNTSSWPEYGAIVDVRNDIVLASGSWIYPHSHPNNGGSPIFRMKNLYVAEGAGFAASGIGFSGKYTPLTAEYGYGPGRGYNGGGGAYGAVGGSGSGGVGGNPYGYSNAPAMPGSAGGSRSSGAPVYGGAGGGLIWLEASKHITMDGTLVANGQAPLGSSYQGSGSGGGILVSCLTFSGGSNAIMRANSVESDNGSGGSGGRIAVWWGGVKSYDRTKLLDGQTIPEMVTTNSHPDYLGSAAANPVATSRFGDGGPGSIVFIYFDYPPPGTIFIIR